METTCPNGHIPEGDERFCQQCGAVIHQGPVQEVDEELPTPAADRTVTGVVMTPPVAPRPAGTIGERRDGQPSVAPTLLVTVFFGLFGLWPAIRHSRMARHRGLPAGRYWWAFGIPVVASLLFTVGVLAAVAASQTTSTLTLAPASAPTTTSMPAPALTTTSTSAPATTSTQTPTPSQSTTVTATAEMQSWPNDPQKCGPSPAPQSTPFSANGQYYVTATIHVWSAPSTSSTPLAVITVNQYGTGGVGCPTDGQPVVTVNCKTTGDAITGPFGTDSTWEQIPWGGSTGFVPDEWVNTQWDVNNFASC